VADYRGVTLPDLLQPGDVVVVRTGGWEAGLIRFGSALRGQPNLDNHVAVVHHKDSSGTLWGIEGRPGGVGWVDVAVYFTGARGQYTLTNALQPKTAVQRDVVAATCEAMLHTPYDWPAIAQDALQDLHLPELWAAKWNGTTPGHVVCSSLASWAHRKAALAAPATTDARHVEPSDWAQFIIERGWSAAR
jgi:hypothetical protein